MSNARARDKQLHRKMLAPKRVTDRSVTCTAEMPRHDNHCSACGYLVCSCAAPQPGAFVIPKGWSDGGTCCHVDGSDPHNSPRIMASGHMRGHWRAGRDREPLALKDYASPYAAMLCALGCEVTHLLSTMNAWLVDGLLRFTNELPAVVERLTAERARTAKASESEPAAEGLP